MLYGRLSRTIYMTHVCCLAHMFVAVSHQIENCNHLSHSFFSCTIFRDSALAPNLAFEPSFGKADVVSLVHSRECVKATAVSMPSFEADLVAES